MLQFPDLEKLFKTLIGCSIVLAIITLLLGIVIGWLVFGG